MSDPTLAGASLKAEVDTARRCFDSGRTIPIEWRRRQLEALDRLLAENAPSIERALKDDLGRAPIDAYLTEVSSVRLEIKHTLKRLRRWTRDRRVRLPLALAPGRALRQRQPLGTVLIIGAWNYPFHLTLMPLVGALGAGNSVVLKPSEVAPASSAVIADLVPRYLDPEAVRVVEGGVDETSALLEHRFDHIFYTGNGAVGSIVMAAAAPRLTPVTLELGGKSPVWVDDSFPLEVTARQLAWGKFSNNGQTCVAPDYVLTTPDLVGPLSASLAAAVKQMYGDDPRTSPDYSRIVNERHTERLAALMSSGVVALGGQVDVAARYVAPTVLVDVTLDSPVMQEEIFGPILPVVAVSGILEAVEVIRDREKPLALYAFTNRDDVREALLERTSSGGICFGAPMLQLGVPDLPFGGVGASGMGAYHGEHSIRTFSHERAVLHKGRGPVDLLAMARPPFTARKEKMLRR